MNLFPCLVTVPDGESTAVYQTCRVHFDGQTTRIYWWDGALRDARAVVESSAAPERNAPGSRNYTLDVDGRTVSIRHLTSCGCGHPMKRWRLPGPVRQG